jgi:hypothetical protein
VGELSETLTEVTARAGRAGRLPEVAAVRARGERRRRRQRAGATTVSVVVLTGLAFGLLNSSVLTAADRAPQVPAHSGVLTPEPTPTPTPTATPVPATSDSRRPTTGPTAASPDPSEVARQRRLTDAENRRLATDKERASTLASQKADADRKAALLKRGLLTTTSTTTTRRG